MNEAVTGVWLLWLSIFPMCHDEPVDGTQTVLMGVYELYGGPQGCGTAEDILKAGGMISEHVRCEWFPSPPPREHELDEELPPEWQEGRK